MDPRLSRPLLALSAALVALAGCVDDGSVAGALRVISYNVARGYALDVATAPALGGLLPDRWSLRAALRDDPGLQGAAIFALQEVCGEDGAEHVAALADALWAATPPSVVFHRADPDRPGACGEGNAIVTRLPMRDGGAFALPKVGGMVRTAVYADLALDDGGAPLRVYSLHLDHSAKNMNATAGRLLQMQAVLDHIAAFRAAAPDAAVLLAGDLNTLAAHEPALDAAQATLQSALAAGTTTHVLGGALDWIFYRGLLRRDATTVALPFSDHLAVRADFDGVVAAEAAVRTDAAPALARP